MSETFSFFARGGGKSMRCLLLGFALDEYRRWIYSVALYRAESVAALEEEGEVG